MADVSYVWFGMPQGLTEWKCPECDVSSPVEDWREVFPYCEDCGDHDGRECPNCHHWFDHVRDSERLGAAQKITAIEDSKPKQNLERFVCLKCNKGTLTSGGECYICGAR